MDEIKRLTLLCDAIKYQRDQALQHNAGLMVDLTVAVEERDEARKRVAELEKAQSAAEVM